MKRSFENFSVSEIRFLIDEWIKNEVHRDILKRNLIDGRTYEQLAEEFNFSISQIKRILNKGKNIIFSKKC